MHCPHMKFLGRVFGQAIHQLPLQTSSLPSRSQVTLSSLKSTIRPYSNWSLARHPLIVKSKNILGIKPKPLVVPTSSELAQMDDEQLYLWALKLEKTPSPHDSKYTIGQKLLLTLISKNHLQAKYTYATLVITNEIIDNPQYAIKLLSECSEMGHSWAKANLAKVLSENRLVCRDVERAIVLYKEAWYSAPLLSRTHAFTSAFNLHNLYRQTGDFKNALEWLRIAADQAQDPLAQYQLGFAYANGLYRVEIDMPKALEYTRKAADKGLALAQHNVGCLYIQGQAGIMVDYVAAAYYFALAHYQDFYWSTLNLAIMYSQGIGVSSSPSTSMTLLTEVRHYGNIDHQVAANDVFQMIRKGNFEMNSDIWYTSQMDVSKNRAEFNQYQGI